MMVSATLRRSIRVMLSWVRVEVPVTAMPTMASCSILPVTRVSSSCTQYHWLDCRPLVKDLSPLSSKPLSIASFQAFATKSYLLFLFVVYLAFFWCPPLFYLFILFWTFLIFPSFFLLVDYKKKSYSGYYWREKICIIRPKIVWKGLFFLA